MTYEQVGAHANQVLAQREGDLRACRQVLSELIHFGSEISDMVGQDISARSKEGPNAVQGGDVAQPDLVTPFVHLSTAIQRAILLDHTITGGQASDRPASGRLAGRKGLLRDVEGVIRRRAAAGKADAPPDPDFLDRLDSLSFDIDRERDERPAIEIMADVCRDLGLAQTLWAVSSRHKAAKDIVALCSLAAAPRRALLRLVTLPDKPRSPPDPAQP